MPGRSRRVGGDSQTSNDRVEKSTPPLQGITGATNQKDSGGLFGWAHRAGDWIGDKWNQTTEAVGEFVDDSVAFVGDVVDVVTDTDVDYKDGVLDVKTDLDEVADLMPEKLAKQFQFDREGSDNLVGIKINKSKGTITLSSTSLAFKGLNLDALSAGATKMEDVEITLTDPDGKLSLFDGLTNLESYNIQVCVGGVDVTSLVVKGKNGEASTEVDQVDVNGLEFSGTRDKDGLAASIGAQQVNATGLSGSTTAKSLMMKNLAGSMSSTGEKGAVSIGSVDATDIVSEKGRGSASLQGLSMKIQNKDGGMPFIDDKADHLSAHVDLDVGTIRDAKAKGTSLGYLELLNASFDADKDNSSLSGSWDKLSVEDVDGPTSIKRASVDSGSLSYHDRSVGFDIGSVTAQGVDASKSTKKTKKKTTTSTQSGGDPDSLQIDGKIGDLDVTNIKLRDGVALDRLASKNLGVSVTDSQTTMRAGWAQTQGVRAGDLSIGTAEGGGVVFDKEGDKMGISATSLKASNVQKGKLSIGSAATDNASVKLSSGHLSASASQVGVSGLKNDGLSVGAAQANNLTLDQDRKSGALNTRVSDASVHNLIKGNSSLTQANIGSTSVHIGAGGGQTVHSDGVSFFGLKNDVISMNSGSVEDVDFAHGGGNTDMLLGQIDIAGLKSKQADLKTLSSSGVDVHYDGTTYDADVQNTKLTGLQNTYLSADELSMGKSHLKGSPSATDLTVHSASGKNLNTESASAGTFDVQGLHYQNSTKKTVDVTALHATNLAGAGAIADSATVNGAHFESDKASSLVRVHDANLTGIHASGADIASASATGITADMTATQDHYGMKDLSASGVQYKRDGRAKKDGDTKSSGSADFDLASVIASGARRVDNADVNMSVGMTPGKIGSGLKSVGIEEGTVLSAHLGVENNHIGRDTQVGFNKPLDTALWTHARGLYVNKKDQLKVDLAGAPDMVNLSKHLNEGLGLGGKSLHSIREYGAAYANSSSSSTTTQGTSDSELPVDMASLALNGSVGLSSGELSTGAGSVTLDSDGGANQLDLNASNGSYSVGSEKIAAAAIQLHSGGTSTSVSRADLEKAQVLYKQNGGDLEATLQAIRLQDISVTRKH